jgi:ferredoxin
MSRPVIEIDPAVCIGSGECVLAEPNIFAIHEDGAARVIDPAKARALEPGRRQEIAIGCPSGAISVNEPSDDAD